MPKHKQIMHPILIRDSHENVYVRLGRPFRPVTDCETENRWICVVAFPLVDIVCLPDSMALSDPHRLRVKCGRHGRTPIGKRVGVSRRTYQCELRKDEPSAKDHLRARCFLHKRFAILVDSDEGQGVEMAAQECESALADARVRLLSALRILEHDCGSVAPMGRF